jgi:zinc/manganese transport system permease protein
MLSGGGLLWTDWKDVGIMAAIYSGAGLFLYLNRETLALCSFNPREAMRRGISVRLWDFLFYACFGIVVTESVRAAGVLAVFSFLIVPVVCATLLGKQGRSKLYWAWGGGAVVSIVGSAVSYSKDLPPGATIVCIFGLVVLGISMFTRVQNPTLRVRATRKIIRARI